MVTYLILSKENIFLISSIKKSDVRFIFGLLRYRGRVDRALHSKHIRPLHCSEATYFQVGYLTTLSLSILHSVRDMMTYECDVAAGIMNEGGSRTTCPSITLSTKRACVGTWSKFHY
jgi:hypothetical protein